MTAAVGRTLEERRRRRRLLARICASAPCGVLALAVLAPSALGPGLRSAGTFASEAMGSVIVSPPPRRPVLVTNQPAEQDLLVRPPQRRPVLSVTRRDA
jgi:hypothetical protein